MSETKGLTKEVFLKALIDAKIIQKDHGELTFVDGYLYPDVTYELDKAFEQLVESCKVAAAEQPTTPQSSLCAIKRTYHNGLTDYCIFKLPAGIAEYVPAPSTDFDTEVVSLEEAMNAQPGGFGWLSQTPEQTRC